MQRIVLVSVANNVGLRYVVQLRVSVEMLERLLFYSSTHSWDHGYDSDSWQAVVWFEQMALAHSWMVQFCKESCVDVGCSHAVHTHWFHCFWSAVKTPLRLVLV